jgi:DNA-binding IclR family transcriptional regulator
MPEGVTLPLIKAELKRTPQPADLAPIEAARRDGLSSVEGALVPGVNAVSVPIFDHKNRIAGVIGALGRSEELDTGNDAAVAKALRQAAQEVSRQIGGQMDGPKTDVLT